MYESQKRIARRFKNMLSEVAPYVIKKRYQIPDWEFFRSPDFKSPQGKGEKVTVGFSWAPEPFLCGSRELLNCRWLRKMNDYISNYGSVERVLWYWMESPTVSSTNFINGLM